MRRSSDVRSYYCYYYQDLPFPWLCQDCSKTRLTQCFPGDDPRTSEGAERWHDWLVQRLLLTFPSMETSSSSPFFLCVSSPLDLRGLLVILVNSPMETLPQHSKCTWGRGYVCSPCSPFSKKRSHLHHFCESRAFFWHIVRGLVYQQMTHRR